jgi:hypothetical protein
MNALTDSALQGASETAADDTLEQSAPANDEENGERAIQPKLDIGFLALDGQPIAKMGVAIRWKDGEQIALTDKKGAMPPVEAPPGSNLTIAVQRFDGSYKKIGECCMPASDGVLTAVSPNIVVETVTEKHEGDPGNAEKKIPKAGQGDLGDLKPAAQSAESESTPPKTSPEETAPAAEQQPPNTSEPDAPASTDKPAPAPKPVPKHKTQPKPSETKAKH